MMTNIEDVLDILTEKLDTAGKGKFQAMNIRNDFWLNYWSGQVDLLNELLNEIFPPIDEKNHNQDVT